MISSRIEFVDSTFNLPARQCDGLMPGNRSKSIEGFFLGLISILYT